MALQPHPLKLPEMSGGDRVQKQDIVHEIPSSLGLDAADMVHPDHGPDVLRHQRLRPRFIKPQEPIDFLGGRLLRLPAAWTGGVRVHIRVRGRGSGADRTTGRRGSRGSGAWRAIARRRRGVSGARSGGTGIIGAGGGTEAGGGSRGRGT
jgi:hypothetical protein